jgi:dTDP-4-dehydrorhamnose reductase
MAVTRPAGAGVRATIRTVRVWISGGSGFVGSNVVKVFTERHGAEVVAPGHADVDLTDADAVRASVTESRPDAIVHSAILNDLPRMVADRRAGWDAYVGATRHLVDAANEIGAKVVLVSTDWVFDGTQAGAEETTPPNPINIYGVLKLASELVVSERARDGAVARISAVNGVHWARPVLPRAQDAGFGYFVSALVDSVSAGEPFTVWESDEINMVATPSLASDCAELMWRIIDRDQRGIFHCCGGEAIGRQELAELAAEVFELDPELVRSGPPIDEAGITVPYDTSLTAPATSSALGVDLPSVRDLLVRFRHEHETRTLAPALS